MAQWNKTGSSPVLMEQEKPAFGGGDGRGRGAIEAIRNYLYRHDPSTVVDRRELQLLRQPYPLSDDTLSSLLANLRREGWILETLGRTGKIRIIALPGHKVPISRVRKPQGLRNEVVFAILKDNAGVRLSADDICDRIPGLSKNRPRAQIATLCETVSNRPDNGVSGDINGWIYIRPYDEEGEEPVGCDVQ